MESQEMRMFNLPYQNPSEWLWSHLDPYWQNVLAEKIEPGYRDALANDILKEYANGQIYPPYQLIFQALNTTRLESIKVVILGQDPYPAVGKAMGLAFSVPITYQPIPRSLQNIYKELENDNMIIFTKPNHGDLTTWANQGILLLNTILTVKAGIRNSHAKIGWQKFTDAVLDIIREKCVGVVFLLMGQAAKTKQQIIAKNQYQQYDTCTYGPKIEFYRILTPLPPFPVKHSIIKTAHPSPLSYKDFENCRCFSAINAELQHFGKTPINWTLPIV